MISIKQLIVFTSHFPYYPGEQFFETELEFLSKEFDKIYLVPVSTIDPASDKRYVPDNAQTIIIDSASKNISAILPIFYLKDVLKEIIQNKEILTSPVSLKKMMSYLYRRYIIDKWLYEFLYDKKSDDIYLYSYWMSEPAYAISKYNKSNMSNIHKISRVHAYELYKELYSPAYLPFRQDIISNLDKIFTISQDGFDYLKRNYNIDNNKLILARLGVKDSNIKSSKSDDSVLRIVTCSRMVGIKRIPLLAKALLLIQGINIEWTHMGGGPEENIVKEIVQKMPDNIKVNLTGDIPNSDVLNFYKTHPVDLFINVSQNEGLPVSIMEAISYGIPVIATDVGGVKEIVTDELGILLTKDLTPEMLSKAIVDFYNTDDETKIKMRENAREMYLKNYNSENNYTKFIKDIIKN